MTAATLALRDAGYTVAQLHLERVRLLAQLPAGERREWRAMLESVMNEHTPRFRLGATRYALRYGAMRRSPMASLAVCDECGGSADDCRCAIENSGHLYFYTCPECDAPCEDGEPCCSPDEDDEDDDTCDGYSRESWSGIARRDLMMLGDAESWSPYRVGIELETDSTPSSFEWRGLRESVHILGAWTDGTVRGPEIVTQPCRGSDLARVVAMLCDLRVSLASSSDPAGQQCGMHIHIDASHMTHSARRAFARLWRVVAPALHEDPDLHLRARGGYACPLSESEIDQIIDEISSDEPRWPSRYRDCNFASLSEHGTIEVRLWGWPERANTWAPRERRAFVYRCIRRTQALRLAARLIGESRLESAHPVLDLDADDALALVESLVPLYSEV